MVSSTTQKWIEAAKILIENPKAKVLCPECLKDNLLVMDIRGELDPEVLERKIYCPICGAMNYIRLKRPIF